MLFRYTLTQRINSRIIAVDECTFRLYDHTCYKWSSKWHLPVNYPIHSHSYVFDNTPYWTRGRFQYTASPNDACGTWVPPCNPPHSQTSQTPLRSVAADYLVQSRSTVVHPLLWERPTERRNWRCLPWRPIREKMIMVMVMVIGEVILICRKCTL